MGNTFGPGSDVGENKPKYDIFIASGKTATVSGNVSRAGSRVLEHVNDGSRVLVSAEPLATLPAAAIDPATTQALVNSLRAALIGNGLHR